MSDPFNILDNIEQLAPKKVGIEEFAESSDYANVALYPRQLVLLKLLLLEEMTGPEEDVLTHWINGGRNGSEICISPDIRERRDFLREHGYKHFREIQLAVGRRASKGFITGIVLAYKLFTTLQLGNPGEYYGIDPKKEIYFSCIAGSESQAKRFQYADMVSRIESNKAFEPYIAESLETEIRIMTPADISSVSAARARGSIIKRDQARLRGNALAANAGTLRGSATMALSQPLDAQILTPSGWTTMGELEIGDSLIGSDGRAQTVLKTWDRGVLPAYRVSFSDGSSTVCGPDHLWTFYHTRKTHKGKTKTILDFANDLTKKGGSNKPDYYKWALPQMPVIQYNESQELPIAPYLLGALLGDGSFARRSGVAFYNVDEDIIEEVRKSLPEGHELTQNPKELIQFRIVKSNKKTGPTHLNKVREAINNLGLGRHSAENKFIPTLYLCSSFEDRLALLQGLLDTDGSAGKDSAVKFGTISYQLALDVVELVRSLGGYATIHHRPANNKVRYFRGRPMGTSAPLYEVCIGDLRHLPLFRCQRKLDRIAPYQFFTRRRRRLLSVEYIGDVEQRCITVSNEDGLYITDDMIITHNCIDEAAHMIAGESKSSAQEVYNAASPALDQFGIDGILFCNSSPYSKVGMFHDLYLLGMMGFDPTRPVDLTSTELLGDDADKLDTVSNGDPRRVVFQAPSWALFEGYMRYTSKYKPRERGKMLKQMPTVSPDWNPDEVDEDGVPLYSEKDKGAIIQARATEAADPETYKVERRGQFAEVVEAWLSPFMVDRMYEGRPIGLVQQPNGDMVMGYEPLYTNRGVGVAVNQFRYKFHLDPSSTTAGFGFAIGHIEYLPDLVSGTENPHCIFDMVKRWVPSKQEGGVIRWKPILDEVVMYAKIFNPFEITMDQHQTAAPLQELQERLNQANIPCQVYMTQTNPEINWKKSEVFKTALYQGLVHAPCDEEAQGNPPYTSKEELKFLQQIQTGGRYPRIDKQNLGPVQTKDMCLHPSHEVLTSNGWKPIADVTLDDYVASRSPDGTLDYHQPRLTHARPVDEDLYYYGSKEIDLAVTGNHELLVMENGKAVKQRIDSIGSYVEIPALATANADVGKDLRLPELFASKDPNLFAYFVGLWLRLGEDPKHKEIVLWTVDKSSESQIEWLLDKADIKHRARDHDAEKRYWLDLPEVNEYLADLILPAEGRHVPQEAFVQWSTPMLTSLYRGLVGLDYDEPLNRPQVFDNPRFRLVSDMQRLALHLGQHVSPILHNGVPVAQEGKFNGYSTVIGGSQLTNILWREHIVKKHYKGQVYCLTMPWGNFLTRRNGVVNWIGNCDAIIDVTWSLLGNLQLQTMRERLMNTPMVGGSPGGYGLGQRRYPTGSPMPLSTDGSYLYSPHSRERAHGESSMNPARGAIGNMRKGGSRISRRGRF